MSPSDDAAAPARTSHASVPSVPATARALRILLVSDYYPPFIGGVQRQVQLLARELSARGHHVEVATVWSPGAARWEMDGPVAVHRVRQLRSVITRLARPGKHHPPPFPDPVIVVGLRHVIGRMRPDVVHAYGWFSYSCAAALTGSDIPLVLSVRDYGYSCATRTMLHRGRPCSGPRLAKCLVCASRYHGPAKGAVATIGVRLFRPLLVRRVRAIHSISRYIREVVRRDFIDDRNTELLHVVLPSFREADPRPPSEADPRIASYLSRLPAEPFIMFAGALRREKGLVPLLEAYRRLETPPPLVLIGTAERDTPTEFPAGVLVVHDFPHEAVMAAWGRCLFGVLPSLWPEPLGSVVYEAMSCGKAVIGTVPGGHADMIEDGVSGRLVPAGDVDALADAMRELIDRPALRALIGRNARERAAQFTAGSVVPELESVYLSLASRGA
jgi:glycosyltransferase involved in cell wall biosynthesis